MEPPTRRHANVVKSGEVPPGEFEKGARFALANRPIGRATGARDRDAGDGPLRYLCFSTLPAPEAVGYPDSRTAGALSADGNRDAKIRLIVREDSAVDYYDGERP